MHDGVTFEERGVPAVVVVTTAFQAEAERHKAALGMSNLEIAVIEHPLLTQKAEGIAARAAHVVKRGRDILLTEKSRQG